MLLFTFSFFNLVLNHFFLIFHISFGKTSLTHWLTYFLACLLASFLRSFLPSFLPSFLSFFLTYLLTYLLKLSTRFHSDVAINLLLSMNFILHDINSVVLLPCLMIFTPFFIEMEKVLYFSLFFEIQSNWPSNSLFDSLMIKWKAYFEPLWKTTWISLGTMNFKF